MSIDGKPGKDCLTDAEEYVSGSPQLKRFRALNMIGKGLIDSDVNIKLIRNKQVIEVNSKRILVESNLFFNSIVEFDFPRFKKLAGDIYYINLSGVTNKQIFDSLHQLSKAKGIIFDSRFDGKTKDYTDIFNMSGFIPYLVDTVVYSAWWNIPQIVYPDRKEVTFHQSHWTIQPKEPKIRTKIVFINDPSVVSSGESYMGIFENYKLAEFVGEPTAGCNGNANFIPLLGGFEIMFTGMKVLKHDGSQHHLVGIKPTYPVQRTIKAIKEGKDEYLEKAIEVIKAQTN